MWVVQLHLRNKILIVWSLQGFFLLHGKRNHSVTFCLKQVTKLEHVVRCSVTMPVIFVDLQDVHNLGWYYSVTGYDVRGRCQPSCTMQVRLHLISRPDFGRDCDVPLTPYP